jgi:hypothetical protein
MDAEEKLSKNKSNISVFKLADSNSDFIDKSKISLKKLANFNLD